MGEKTTAITYISVKNWEEFQHYRDRQPPWIKLHRQLLDDYEFSRLQDASKAHLMLIWLLASQLDNKIPNDPQWIARRVGADSPIDLNLLISKGFILLEQDASAMIARCSPETEAETQVQTEADTHARAEKDPLEFSLEQVPNPATSEFQDWYGKYPNKVGRADAEKAFRKARKKATISQLIDGLERYIARKPPDREWCNPATWLNQERWADEMAGPAVKLVTDRSAQNDLRAAQKAENEEIFREAMRAT